MGKHRDNSKDALRAGKAPRISKKDLDEGLDAALKATGNKPIDPPSFAKNNLETNEGKHRS